MDVLVYGSATFPQARVEASMARLRRKHPGLRVLSAFRVGAEQFAGIWAMAHGVDLEHRALNTTPRAEAAVSFGDPENADRARAAGLPVWALA